MTEKEQPYKILDSWQWTTLEEVSNIIMGQSPNGDETTDDPSYIPLIGGAADMGDLFPIITRYTKKPTKLSQKGDVIVCVRATLGRPIYSNGEYCLGRGVAAIRSDILLKEFIRYYLIRNERYLYDNAAGSLFLQITSKKLKKMPVPLPPLDEQIRIVEIIESLFEKLNRAKSLAQDIVDKYELRRGKITYDAFTGKLTHSNTDDWVNVTLKDICRINPPKVPTKNLPDELEVTFVPMPSVSAEYGTIKEPKTRRLVEVKTGFTNFSEGDVIFAKITPCMENGKSAVVEDLINDIGYGSTEFFVFRCGERLYNRFLYHLVRSKFFRDKARLFMHGSVGQLRVPRGFLESYDLKLPPIEEQKEIVHHLDSLLTKEQRTKELAESVLNRIEKMKKKILGMAFRGKLTTNISMRK